MNVAQQLDILQELDLDLDLLNEQLITAQAGQGPTPDLEAARAALQAGEAGLEERRKVVQDREWDARQGQEQMAPLEANLYSGRVTNPKELAKMQRDLDSLKARQGRRDERLLEAMIAVEEAQDRVRAGSGHLAQVEEAWQANQDRLRREEAALHEKIAALQARRQAQSAAIDPPSLSVYQRLRPTKGGRAVARLVGSICQGCHIALPSGDAARARQSPELVFCINCDRILCSGGILHK